jgi:hypothetical protein
MTHGKIIHSVGGDRGTFIIIIIIIIHVKVKGSLYRPKARRGVEVSSTLSLNSALDRVDG